MTPETLAAWLLTAMIAWNPPAQHREGEKAATERYTSMANDIAAVALDAEESPLFEGPQGRPQTALLIAATASFESSYRKDVDTGQTKGDSGRSWCMLQVQVFGKTAEKWTGDELIQDRKKCVRAGLHKMKESFTMCKALPLIDRLSAYTCGTCRAEPKAEWRVKRALGWFKSHPLGLTDT
ncbi:MAG: uncharacterized protein JWM74_322 [Myxococcaceae bacterium]|jgi:hypothetical protein|nr:uncharacterized protein [Myxococcaceae bacterium]